MTGNVNQSFRIGSLRVDPINGQLTDQSGEKTPIRPKVMELLIYLASRAGEVVSNDDLITHVWPGVHVSNAAIYYTINKLRTALGDDRHQPKYIETVPKRGYRLIAEVSFEEQVSGDVPDQTAGEVHPKKWAPISAVLIVGIFAILLATFAYRISFAPTEDTVPQNSIAVLPFVNLSGDIDNEYFSDGVAEEILNLLAQIPNLHVTSRSSAFQFKDSDIDIPAIGAQLGVANILEGSVRRSGTRLRIAAQLIDAGTDKHLWSGIYDREIDDIFAVQDEISADIVEALASTMELELQTGEGNRSNSFVANRQSHEAFLRGRYLVEQRSRSSIEDAVHEFENAISLEPEYARAHAELAIAILMLVWDQYGDLIPADAIAQASPHVDMALSINPLQAEAHAARGLIAAYQQKPEKGVAHYRRATQLNPNYAIVYSWMANLLQQSLGGYKEAFEARDRSLTLDPLSKSARYSKVVELIATNQLSEADHELKKIASVAPAFYAHAKGQRNSVGGQWSNAIFGNLEALTISADFSRSKFHVTKELAKIHLPEEIMSIYDRPYPDVWNRVGQPEVAVASTEWWLTVEPGSISPLQAHALALAGVGDYDRAQPFLEELWQKSGGLISSTGIFQIPHAAALFAARRAKDEEADVEDLLTALKDEARRLREAGIVHTVPRDFPFDANSAEGMALYLASNKKKGLSLIAKAVSDGHFIWPKEAYLQDLYDDPGFATILANQKAQQTRERNKVLAIVCDENPYATVWQPAEETCETFLAANRK